MSGQHIMAAMSGGVDSSVMAYLLLQQGYTVTGATMKLYAPSGTTASQDITDAANVCCKLGIPHRVYDFRDIFARYVLQDFVSEYEAGRTPNPCVVCNRYLKFGALWDAAHEAGAESIATGHYVRTERQADGRVLLKKAVDDTKDQSYVLWSLTQEQLSHALFPLGSMRKSDIRILAEEVGLLTAHKSDSQDICFVPDGDYASFLCRYTGHAPLPGDYVDSQGRVLGQHKGIIHYTVGQRKGLGIAMGHPLFVLVKDAGTRRVVLGENQALYRRSVLLHNLNLIATSQLDTPVRCEAKLRYRHTAAPATLIQTGEKTATLLFDQPQRAPAPGQSAVMYDGDTVLGGGLIAENSSVHLGV